MPIENRCAGSSIPRTTIAPTSRACGPASERPALFGGHHIKDMPHSSPLLPTVWIVIAAALLSLAVAAQLTQSSTRTTPNGHPTGSAIRRQRHAHTAGRRPPSTAARRRRRSDRRGLAHIRHPRASQPARMVPYSAGADERNVTLGAEDTSRSSACGQARPTATALPTGSLPGPRSRGALASPSSMISRRCSISVDGQPRAQLHRTRGHPRCLERGPLARDQERTDGRCVPGAARWGASW